MRLKYKDYKSEHHDIVLRKARHGEYPCFYCGVPSGSIDHFIPQAYERSMRAFVEIRGNIREEIEDIMDKQQFIPSCSECNSLASDGIFDTPDDKKGFVKAKLRKRYQHILDVPGCDFTAPNY